MTDEMTRHVYLPSDIGDWHITAEVHSHWIDFKCCECKARDTEGSLFYERKDTDVSYDMVKDPAEAQVFLEGSIKWDGCSNLQFPEQDTAMLHFCGRSDASKVGKLIDHLYDLTEELLSTYDDPTSPGPTGSPR